jgi:two-component system chemotaxis response regulator CheY
MPKRVLSIGQCGPDDAALRRLLARHFDVDFHSAEHAADALEQIAGRRFDLVLVNRKLDIDYSDGMDIIRTLKSQPATADLPVMLVTNYPEHQAEAVAAGAAPGFGKLEFGRAETIERLGRFLGGAQAAGT